MLEFPRSDELLMTPRAYGMVGKEASLYFRSMHSGEGPRTYDVGIGTTVLPGSHQSDRWFHAPTAAVTAQAMTISALDINEGDVLDTASFTYDAVLANAAAGAPRRIVLIGDSNTNRGVFSQRILDNATGSPGSVVPTLMGTLGTGLNRHEGRSGWGSATYLNTKTSNGFDNAFIQTSGLKFDASYYLSSTGQAAPDIVVWLLGTNEFSAPTTDAAANTAATGIISNIGKMIGIIPDAAVGSWLEAAPNAKHLICLPFDITGNQDGYGDDYTSGRTRWRGRRNLAVCWHRMITEASWSEANGIFLIPTHACIDPVSGWPKMTVLANASINAGATLLYATMMADISYVKDTLCYAYNVGLYFKKFGAPGVGGWRLADPFRDGAYVRDLSGVHPDNPAILVDTPHYHGGYGYFQIGDTLTQAINVLVAKGLA